MSVQLSFTMNYRKVYLHCEFNCEQSDQITCILCYKQYIQTFSSCYSLSPVFLWTLLRLCACNMLDVVKLLSHSEHLYGFSPVWNLMWTFSFEDQENALSHKWHLYGFSPLWILLCLTRSLGFVNRLVQTAHSNLTVSSSFNSLSAFLCTKRLCCCKLRDWAKLLLYSEQLNGFFPEWTLMPCTESLCSCKWPDRL